MIFPEGASFIFGDWVCTAGKDGQLSSKLRNSLDQCKGSKAAQLTEKVHKFTTPKPTRENSVGRRDGLSQHPASKTTTTLFPLGFRNAAHIYKELLESNFQSVEVPLTGAQQGLVLSLTRQGYAVHWPGAKPGEMISDDTRIVGMVEILPFQEGGAVCEDASTEIIQSVSSAESTMSWVSPISREILMVRQRTPIIRPIQPEILEGEETEEAISDDQQPIPNETDEHRVIREAKNKSRNARRQRARARKAALDKYEAELEDYNRRILAREAEDQQYLDDQRRVREREEQRRRAQESSRNLLPDFIEIQGVRVYNDPFANIYELATELNTKQNLTPEQQKFKVVLEAAAIQLKGGQPRPSGQESQPQPQASGSQRAPVHERLGPNPHPEGSKRQSALDRLGPRPPPPRPQPQPRQSVHERLGNSRTRAPPLEEGGGESPSIEKPPYQIISHALV
ncbi:MAG TPA: hypothetical protein VFM05_10340 [Candidatus Saccharimonadales bacterium]|nr:hypothetical protein [Candidatus Saccharimonadales bacterium]